MLHGPYRSVARSFVITPGQSPRMHFIVQTIASASYRPVTPGPQFIAVTMSSAARELTALLSTFSSPHSYGSTTIRNSSLVNTTPAFDTRTSAT